MSDQLGGPVQVILKMFSLGFLKNGSNPASFCLLSLFSHSKYSTNIITDKRVDGVLGIQTRGGRMVGTDESTELWRHPMLLMQQF